MFWKSPVAFGRQAGLLPLSTQSLLAWSPAVKGLAHKAICLGVACNITFTIEENDSWPKQADREAASSLFPLPG